MQLPPILILAANTDCGVFNEMLRLFGIAAIVHAFFKGIKSLMPLAAAPPPPHPAPATYGSLPQPTAAAVAGITPEILAVIAAAVATATSSSHRIVAIRSESSQWEKAGRQSVLTSHRIR